jgi:tetratricopeptide (TPR) repeat protein
MIVGPLGCVALLADLIFANADWATGAVVAALVAIILAILLGIAAGVRIALGLLQASNPRRRSQVISTALFVLLLLLFSGVGISQQNGLHMAQGRYFESHQNWAAAIAQYQAAGEKPPSAVDVARTYDEWGEAQNRQQQYADAVTHFSTVLQNYQDATNEFNTAKTTIITSYLDWAGQAVQQQNYAAATAHYDALLALPFCATTCKPLAQPQDATAYYHLAEQQLSQHQYAQAVNSYQTLTTRFPSAPEASQIHMHYAQALWGKGQQEVNTACSDALSNYRLLARLFADTSQGKQAATALTQPVAVKGHFTQTIPGAPFHPTAYLVQGLVVGIQQEQFPSLLTRAPAAPINSDGTFTFPSVPQGSYELIWSSDNTLHFYYAFSGQHILYTANLGPLCTYNYGDINQAIPTGAQ